MSLIDEQFQRLASDSQTAFMPFVTAGDPDLAFTAELLKALDSAGCQFVELGFPYSDPIADGPVIQASFTRALAKQIRVDQIFEMTASVSDQIKMPIVAMISYALIFRYGLEKFVERAKASGIAGAIVPDLPFQEAERFAELCGKNDFSLVQLVTPTTPDERAIEIAKLSTGFIYYVSVTGVTGEQSELPDELVKRLAWLKQQTSVPVCVGFGIGRPDQAKMLDPHADGIIVGSAIVKRLADVTDSNRDQTVAEISEFARSMVQSLV